jgi:hypothetical protein
MPCAPASQCTAASHRTPLAIVCTMQMAEVMAKATAEAMAEVTAKATAEVTAEATAKVMAEMAAEATQAEAT